MTSITRRNFGRLSAATLLGAAVEATGVARIPDGHAATVAAGAGQDLAIVHPELRATVRNLRANPMPKITAETLAKARSYEFPSPPLDPEVPVRQQRVEGIDGNPPVTVYVINGKAGGTRPAIVHTHGGGYILGTAKGGVSILQPIAKALDCVIVTVEYRLAPQVRWRGSLADNYAGLKWTYDNASALGIDRERIAVMGESAGGGHAALLAQMARDRAQVPLIFQALIYPMLDDRTGTTRKVPSHIGTLGWSADENRLGWGSFLGRAPGKEAVAGVAGRTASLAGLPPAFIGVGAIDLFVEEDVDYARRLVVAGVPTELLVVPGAFHGFDMADAPISREFTAAKMSALRRAFDERW